MSKDFDPDWPHGHIAHKNGSEQAARYLGGIEHEGYPYAFAVRKWDGGDEELWVVSETGHSPQYGSVVNAPAPKRKFVMWMNCYEKDCAYVYSSRALADQQAASERIACVRVEFEEGEGL